MALTPQLVKDAETDLADIGEIASGPVEPGFVATRFGGPIKTLRRLMADMEQEAAGPISEAISAAEILRDQTQAFLAEALAIAASGNDAVAIAARARLDKNLEDLTDKEAANRNLGTFATRALAQAATIPAILTAITLRGYSAPGDGGGALYKRVASEPTHAGKFQSADGQWWVLVPQDGAVYATQLGVRAGIQNGVALSAAIVAAATLCGHLIVDVVGTITLVGKVTADDRVFAENINGLRLTILGATRIYSDFNIKTEHVTTLFGFKNCNNITVDGAGEIEVVVANDATASRVTFRVFHFFNEVSGPDHIKFYGPLKLRLRAVSGFVFSENYAGYVINASAAPDPAPQAIGFVCDGVDFSGSSGRIIQTQGMKGASIIRNKMVGIGGDFVTVGVRSLGDAEDQIISHNNISILPTGYTTACVVVGTNNVGRNGLARNNLIAENILKHPGASFGVFINASEDTQVKLNTFISDGASQSSAVSIRLQEAEIEDGANAISGVVVTANTIIGANAPLFVYAAPAGGSVSGIRYYGNTEIGGIETAGFSIARTEEYRKGDGAIVSGEVTSPVSLLTINVPDVPWAREYRLIVEGLYFSTNGTLNIGFQTLAGATASALSYVGQVSNYAALTQAAYTGSTAAAIPVSDISTGPGALANFTLDMKTRSGRTTGRLRASSFLKAYDLALRNDNQGQPLLRIVLTHAGGGQIAAARWRVERL